MYGQMQFVAAPLVAKPQTAYAGEWASQQRRSCNNTSSPRFVSAGASPIKPTPAAPEARGVVPAMPTAGAPLSTTVTLQLCRWLAATSFQFCWLGTDACALLLVFVLLHTDRARQHLHVCTAHVWANLLRQTRTGTVLHATCLDGLRGTAATGALVPTNPSNTPICAFRMPCPQAASEPTTSGGKRNWQPIRHAKQRPRPPQRSRSAAAPRTAAAARRAAAG